MTLINRRKFLGTTAIGAAALTAPAIPAFAQQAPIVVGAMHDRTGSHGIYGKEADDAVKLAVKEINEQGGVLGRKIELIAYDTQSNMQNYAQYSQRLATQEKASVVFGGISSASRETARPILNRFEILYFYNTFYEGGVCDTNTFVCGETPAQMIGPALNYSLEKFKAKKLYTMWADYNYGHICSQWLERFAEEAGAELVAKEFYPLDVTDFSTTITKIQEAAPDMVVSGLVGGNHIGFYRQWPAAGMLEKIPLHSTVFGPWEKSFLQPGETEGLVTSFHYFQTIDSPENKSFLNRWHAEYGSDYAELGSIAIQTYNAVNLWKLAAEKADSVDRGEVIKALETGVSFAGPGGKVTVDHQTHHLICSTVTAEVKDGQFVIVENNPDVQPLDTSAVCDLISKPNQSKQYQP